VFHGEILSAEPGAVQPGGGLSAVIRTRAIYAPRLHLKIAAKANDLFYWVEQ
jgi:hypothetical protein